MASPLITFSAYSDSVIEYARALVRETFISLAVKVSCIFVGALTILVAISFCMFGAAHGLAKVIGVEFWLGFLITGAIFLVPTLIFFVAIVFKAKREATRKMAEQQKATERVSRKISELVDVRWWIQKYPFYSTGAAAAAGFTLSNVKTSSAEIQAPIVAMFLALAEDVLKEAVVPFVQEQLSPKVTQ